jgi:hypothetical protein
VQADEDDQHLAVPERGHRGGRQGPKVASGGSTLVLVESLDVVEEGDLILIGVEGSHFLWKMVRRVVGVIVEIGRGGLDPEAAATFLTTSSTAPARLTAPAAGLFLEHVWYPGDARDVPLRAATLLPHAGSIRMPSTKRITSA